MDDSLSIHQVPAARVALALLTRFTDLPGACYWTLAPVASAHYAPGLEIRVHQHPETFEAWREALDIDPNTLVHRQFPGYFSLTGLAWIDGVPVELGGYIDEPTLPETTG